MMHRRFGVGVLKSNFIQTLDVFSRKRNEVADFSLDHGILAKLVLVQNHFHDLNPTGYR